MTEEKKIYTVLVALILLATVTQCSQIFWTCPGEQKLQVVLHRPQGGTHSDACQVYIICDSLGGCEQWGTCHVTQLLLPGPEG